MTREEQENIFKNSGHVVGPHFFLAPLTPKERKDYEDIKTTDGKHSYRYFKVLDADKKVVDVYDYISIEGPTRIDMEDGKFRIYPALMCAKTPLVYDRYSHAIFVPDICCGGECCGEKDTEEDWGLKSSDIPIKEEKTND